MLFERHYIAPLPSLYWGMQAGAIMALSAITRGRHGYCFIMPMNYLINRLASFLIFALSLGLGGCADKVSEKLDREEASLGMDVIAYRAMPPASRPHGLKNDLLKRVESFRVNAEAHSFGEQHHAYMTAATQMWASVESGE